MNPSDALRERLILESMVPGRPDRDEALMVGLARLIPEIGVPDRLYLTINEAKVIIMELTEMGEVTPERLEAIRDQVAHASTTETVD